MITPELVHSTEFSKVDKEYRKELTRLIGEGPQNLWWYTRADHMNKLIAKNLNEVRGKKVLIVVGAFHRPDIEDFLATQTNIVLQKQQFK